MKSFKYSLGGARSRTVTALVLLASLIALTFVASGSGRSNAQAPVNLNTVGSGAGSFGALSFAAMTNAGANTVVNGDVGSSTSIDAGVTHPAHAAYGAGAIQLADAQNSLVNAYNFAAAQGPTGDITGVNLAGQTKTPGVYNSTGAILISGPIALTLDGGGDANAVFIFQAAAAGDLTVDPGSSVSYTNGAQPCNVFWKVQSAFLKNTGKTFVGTILALTQITLTDSITVEGRVLARNADVTFIHDTVNTPTCAAAPPPAVDRQLYCDPATFQSYDLLKGQDKLPPYDKLGLILAYVDPATGAQSCDTLRAIAAAKAAAAAAAKAEAAAAAAAAAAEAAKVEAAKAAAAEAAAAATLAAAKAAEAQAAAEKAATAKAAEAAKLAAVKAAAAKAAAVKAAAVVKAAAAKLAAVKAAAAHKTHARPARRHAGYTG